MSTFNDMVAHSILSRAQGAVVPKNIIDDMLDLIPLSFWRGTPHILDINYESSDFLDSCRRRLLVYHTEEEIWDLLYCVTTSEQSEYLINNYTDYHAICCYIGRLQEVVEMQLKDVKFDLVVGNPPYNNDVYLDFVLTAHNISTQYDLFIVPAKWQSKEDLGKNKYGKNEGFRDNVVPYMSSIYFEQPASKIFKGIFLSGGVTWYLADKQLHPNKEINGVYVKNWRIDWGFDVTFIDIIEGVMGDSVSVVADSKSRFYPQKSYFAAKEFGSDPNRGDYPHEDTTSRFWLKSSRKLQQTAESDFRNIGDMDKWKVYFGHFVGDTCVPHLIEPYVAMTYGSILMGYGSKEECESLASYYSTKLIWFLVKTSSTGNVCTASFKNVPMPEAFDHIFTDEELYTKYSLTSEQIGVIEAAIKERR